MPLQRNGRGLRKIAGVVCAMCGLACVTFASAQTASQAEDLFRRGQYEASLQLLNKNAGDAATAFLVGRDYYMLADFKKAIPNFEKAALADPTRSEYMDWLGRAWGRRAEISSPFLGIGFASKSRQAFERAVELDPKNAEALNDLFTFYLEAPGLLGGGYDKAQNVAEKISAIDAGEGYFAKAQIEERRRELQVAERDLRKSLAVAPLKVDRLIQLAKVLARQGRTRESDAAFAQAQALDPNTPGLWFARADTLIQQNRNLDQAKALLEKYMRAPTTVDDPPKEEAARLLKHAGGT